MTIALVVGVGKALVRVILAQEEDVIPNLG
jgi:hypothetical protein